MKQQSQTFSYSIPHQRRFTAMPATVLAVALLAAANAFAQQTEVPEMTIDQAIDLALRNNASLQSAKLDTARSDKELAANRTKRFANVQLYGLGGQLLTKPSITFAPGALGNFAATGPIPATNQSISIPRKPVGVLSVSIAQPLTTQYKLHLSLKALALGLQATREDERKTRLQTVDQVRRAYYEVVKAQSRLQSSRASLPYYRESKRLSSEQIKQEAILQSDVFQIEAQLLKTENSIADASDSLTTAEEKLNDLVGRDIHTLFRVSDLRSAGDQLETQEAMEARALQNSPALKKAKLQVQQAEYDSRAKKAEYIPDVSLSFNYLKTTNFGNTLPTDITTVGLSLSWEPWDWGRRRQEYAGKRLQEAQAKVAVSSNARAALMEVRGAWRQIENARRQLAFSEANQRAARQKLLEIQEQVKRESKLTKDLFSAQSDLVSADTGFQQALSAFWSARADLQKATGEE